MHERTLRVDTAARRRRGRRPASQAFVAGAASRARSRPVPAAGRTPSASSHSVISSSRCSRTIPAAARTAASTSPSATFCSRVSTLPRSGAVARSGRAMRDQRFAPHRRRPDDRAGVELAERLAVARHEHVARVFAFEDRGELEAVRLGGREVLEAVHGDVDPVVEECRLQLVREDRLRAELLERRRPCRRHLWSRSRRLRCAGRVGRAASPRSRCPV